MAKYKQPGYVIQVGDEVEAKIGNLYRRIDTVTRVTKTLAICDNNGIIRYPRVYNDFGFYAKPYQRTDMQYRVLDETR
jgi:hypothetical protein